MSRFYIEGSHEILERARPYMVEGDNHAIAWKEDTPKDIIEAYYEMKRMYVEESRKEYECFLSAIK